MAGQAKRKLLDSLTPTDPPRWHGDPVTPENVRDALDRAVEFKWDAYRAHHFVRSQAIAALSEQGLSVREVARVLKISKSLVAKQLKEPYFLTEGLIKETPENDARSARTRELISRAWNGLWHPEQDPSFGWRSQTGRES